MLNSVLNNQDAWDSWTKTLPSEFLNQVQQKKELKVPDSQPVRDQLWVDREAEKELIKST